MTNDEFSRLCRTAKETFRCKRTLQGHILIRRSNGEVQHNPTSVKMDGKSYNRNTLINLCLGRRPAPKGSAPAFKVTAPQALFFSKCIDKLLGTIFRLVRSDAYLVFDAVAFVTHRLYTHLAHEGHNYRQKLYATPKGFRRQCAVLNGLLSFGKCLVIMLQALNDWEPVRLTGKRRRQANALTKGFRNWLSMVRRDERYLQFDAILTVLHLTWREDEKFKKRVRLGEASIWDAGIDAVEEAMTRAVQTLHDSIRPPKVGKYTHASVKSGFYKACRSRLYSSMSKCMFIEKYKFLEDIPMLMNDLGIWSSRGHSRYGVNHLLMAVNATGRMEEFLEYFEWHVRTARRKLGDRDRYLRGVRNAGHVWRFTQKHLTEATGFADVDIIRAVRAKTGKPIDRARPSEVKCALMELEEEILEWRTLGSLNVSCE